jgi:hypothetical protein
MLKSGLAITVKRMIRFPGPYKYISVEKGLVFRLLSVLETVMISEWTESMDLPEIFHH